MAAGTKKLRRQLARAQRRNTRVRGQRNSARQRASLFKTAAAGLRSLGSGGGGGAAKLSRGRSVNTKTKRQRQRLELTNQRILIAGGVVIAGIVAVTYARKFIKR